MKHWLVLIGFALVGSMVGVAAKTVIANHTAAAKPATAASTTGA